MQRRLVLCSNGGFLEYLRQLKQNNLGYCKVEIIEDRDSIKNISFNDSDVLLAVSWREVDLWVKALKESGVSFVRIAPVFVIQYRISIFRDMNTFEKYTKYVDLNKDINLTYLETHVTDICNLKCRGCMHFSNLAKQPNEPDLESFEKDLKRLTELFNHIYIIRLLGGEPLLSKKLVDYVRLVRKSFPVSELRIVTNGLLVPRMTEEVCSVLKECHVSMDVSPYPPTIDMIDEIKAFLDSNGIPYGTIAEKLTSFRKSISSEPVSDVEKSMEICGSSHCHFLRDGKIAKCPLVFFIEDFDKYYNYEIHSKDIFDIYKNVDANELKMKLDGASDLCKYCPDHPEFIEWKETNNDAEKSDWVV